MQRNSRVGEAGSSWQPQVEHIPTLFKRELLAEGLHIVAANRELQRIVAEFSAVGC